MASAFLVSAATPARFPNSKKISSSRQTATQFFGNLLGFDFSRINLAWFGAVCRAYDTLAFHLLDHPGGTIVSYPQSSLNHRYRRLLSFGDDGDTLIVHCIVFCIGHTGLRFLLCLKDIRPVVLTRLLFDECHDFPNFMIGNEGTVQPRQARGSGRHV